MLKAVIEFSLNNKFAVAVAALVLLIGGVYSLKSVPLDALPDLSDAQVVVYSEWPGQAPQTVQDQVTYQITVKMLSVPKAKAVRGYSFYGFSFVYVIFEDGTDPYWARSRVLEYLNGLGGSLPKDVRPVLGPDASGVGWAFMYVLESKDKNLAELRSLQDFYMRYGLASVDGVSEVASIGGFVKQYQATVDPNKLRAYKLSLQNVADAVKRANGESGGRSVELGEKEFILRVHGYLNGVEDMRKIPLGAGPNGTPVLLGQVADIVEGPDMRRGIAELNGEGESVGGIVVARQGANAKKVIESVKARLEELKKGLPPDVDVKVVYDRSALIERAVENLESKLIEESVAVALVCLLFLLHLRSALVAVALLPMAVLASFLIMNAQGISSNIMSLGGIAIAIGAMIDAVVVMIENAHKHIERDGAFKNRWDIVRDASLEVGPTLFCSLLLITVSFLPVFALQEQEGRLFKPLAFTKTYSMAAAALLSITVAPILMGLFIRGRLTPEDKNPLTRFLIAVYKPLLALTLRFKFAVIAGALLLALWTFMPWNALVVKNLPEGSLKTLAAKANPLFPFQSLGSEFMPPLYEGDLLYMPTAMPGIAPEVAKGLLQRSDRIVKSFGEVESVFGKAGRAETATDPAPLDMLETTIMLKPESEWPKLKLEDASGKTVERRRTREELVDALDAAVKIPGLTNSWTMPIRARIDMLATGIKTPVGVKVSGPDLETIERLAKGIEGVVKRVDGTASAFAERVMGGYYLDVKPKRSELARFGLNVADVQEALDVAAGGKTLTTTVEGVERYAVTLRFSRDFRENVEAVKAMTIPTPSGAQIPLSQVAEVSLSRGPMSVKSEGAVPNAWVYVDVRGRDLGGYIADAKKAVDEAVKSGELSVPPGCRVVWSGQFEYMQRAKERLLIVVPLTLLAITLILYFNTRSAVKTAIVLLAVPFSLIGAFLLLHLLGYNLSVAVWIGLIALAGLDAETGVVMLLYLELAKDARVAAGKFETLSDLRASIMEGAAQRIRPKMMTASVIIAGLLPIMWSQGAGADVMKRIAAPMIGGVVTSVLLELAVYPAVYYVWQSWRARRGGEPLRNS